ncbi:MAG: sigma 54-interacting transcriptional regulator, partial [Planctomycetota bacterium]|jgi:DNA-binding NtrC family response regulator
VFEELWDKARTTVPEITSATAVRTRSTEAGRATTPPAGLHPPLLDLLEDQDVPADLAGQFIGNSPAAQLVRKLIMRAAKVDEPVLIIGDTGTGKEIVARSIHDYGERRAERFIAVNCGGIPRDLFESELFGHEKGAFTHALARKVGLWKVAGPGTLFLDEIGDMPLNQQAKILRALQENVIRPVGAKVEIEVEARIIAATNRDLYAMVQAGQFRDDLYYRFRSFVIWTPRLRAYPDDIRPLAQHFWEGITGDKQETLPEAVLRELQTYSWPGNARELRAVLNHLHSLFSGKSMGVEHLNAVFQLQGQVAQLAVSEPAPPSLIDVREVEYGRHLRRVDDAIRACRVTLEPVADATLGIDAELLAGVRAEVQRRLYELDGLCDPRLFTSEAAFLAVHELKGKLAYFETLLEADSSSAQRHWKLEMAHELDSAQSTIDEEIQLLREDR